MSDGLCLTTDLLGGTHKWGVSEHHLQDAVARAPKFLVLYKRAGQRALINHHGDMVVRPSAIEVSLIKAPCGKPCTIFLDSVRICAEHTLHATKLSNASAVPVD